MFKEIFLNENVWIPIEISLKFVPKGSINNNPALFQIMAWRRPGDKPLSEPMMVSPLTHICVYRLQWVNWTDVHKDLWCHMVSLDNNDLNSWSHYFVGVYIMNEMYHYTTARSCKHYFGHSLYKPSRSCHGGCRCPGVYFIMASSNGNIFRVTGHLCGEFTSHQWIPHTKASDTELWYFLWSVPE